MPQPDEWVELPGAFRSRNDGVALAAGPVVGGIVGAGGVIGVIGAIVGTIAAALFVALRRRSEGAPLVNRERRAFRVANSEFAFAGISAARLSTADSREYDERAYYGKWSEWKHLTIVLELSPKVAIAVPLRSGDKLELSPEKQAAVIEAIESSSIDIPRDRFDPKGKFARSGSPSHITKDEALGLVRDVPMPGDPLPVANW